MENISRAEAAQALGCTEEELEGLNQEELSQIVERVLSAPKVDESEKEDLDLENFELLDIAGRLVSEEEQVERWLAQVEKDPAHTYPTITTAEEEKEESKPPKHVVYREYRSINSHDPQLLEQFLLGRRGTKEDHKAGEFLDTERFMNLAYEHTSIRTSVYTEAGLALDLKRRGHDVKLNHVVDVTRSKDFMEATVERTAAGLDTDQVDMSVNGLNVEHKRWRKPQFHIDSDDEVWLWLCSAHSYEQWQEPRHYYVVDYKKGWDLKQYAGTRFYTYSPSKHSTVVFDLNCTELIAIENYKSYNRPFPERVVFAKLSDAMTYAEFLAELEA